MKNKVKRISINLCLLLIALQIHCGAYLLFGSYEENRKTRADLSALLASLAGSSGSNEPGALTPLNVEPISWVNFTTNSLVFSQGAGGSFTIAMANPLGCGSLGSELSISLNTDGVPLNLDSSDFSGDGCSEDEEGFIYRTINVTGIVAGEGRVIASLASNIMFSNFPGLYAGQIIGVVSVTVLPSVSTASAK